jgi:hypothetical protein
VVILGGLGKVMEHQQSASTLAHHQAQQAHNTLHVLDVVFIRGVNANKGINNNEASLDFLGSFDYSGEV